MRSHFDGSGSVLVVTGAASGISRAVAEAGHAAGATVCAVDIASRPDQLDPAIHYRQVDVSDRSAMMRLATEVEDSIGEVSGVLCGAVVQPRTDLLAMDPAEWRQVQSVNLDGVLWTCQAFLPAMVRRRRGAVVLFTSGIAVSGWPSAGAYTTTKAAAQALGRSLAAEIAESNVKVNLISPGVIDTPQYRQANAGQDEQHWRQTTGVGRPVDAVGPILFLLSDQASMTGSIVTRERVFRSST